MLPTTPEAKRFMSIYKFKTGTKQNILSAATEFYDYALADDELDRSYLDQLGVALLQVGDNTWAAQVFFRIARNFGDKEALIQAAFKTIGIL